ncbi:hypothetical protein C0Q70_12360 [Pomacea canaliculata]|uniref:Uncharacterized protein n=1 Tax=Pomacea canaliculata TaxID=400727 RepID=A0A2T7P1C0_POMCA|nr:hypothetical protein C0Q70_12360 [Pomacea canaliculata]
MAELVVACAYNEKPRCSKKTGFNITHNGFNDVTITVPDTFAGEGSFECQKGDTDIIKNCPYPPPEISSYISSTKSGIGPGTTTKGIRSSLTTEQFRNEGINPSVPVATIVVPIVAILLIIIIGLVWLRKRRSEDHKGSKRSSIYKGCPSVMLESGIPFLEKENTGNHVEQTQSGRASVNYMDAIMRVNNPTKRDNVLTINKQTGHVTKEHTSTDNHISGGSSGLKTTESSFSKTSSSGSDRSDTLLLSTKFNC